MPRVLTETDIVGFRERLCELATRIYVERGPANFNMRLLAAELGVSAMTPYRYFKDKDEILSAIRARAFGRFADQLERATGDTGHAAGKKRRGGARLYPLRAGRTDLLPADLRFRGSQGAARARTAPMPKSGRAPP